MVSPMRSPVSSPSIHEALATALYYLQRVIPRGPAEEDELHSAIDTIRRAASTPVQPR